MRVKILFFGLAKDLANTSSSYFELSDNSTVKDVLYALEEKYSRFTSVADFSIAVNEEYASIEEIVKENDVIAIIPPVSGG